MKKLIKLFPVVALVLAVASSAAFAEEGKVATSDETSGIKCTFAAGNVKQDVVASNPVAAPAAQDEKTVTPNAATSM